MQSTTHCLLNGWIGFHAVKNGMLDVNLLQHISHSFDCTHLDQDLYAAHDQSSSPVAARLTVLKIKSAYAVMRTFGTNLKILLQHSSVSYMYIGYIGNALTPSVTISAFFRPRSLIC